ncbi:MAG: hypothetical protein DRI24_24690, partial [Deltaproteobacteria bacterium]
MEGLAIGSISSSNMHSDCTFAEKEAMYRHRTLESFFADAATHFPVMLATGARQVGKTTFLRHLSGEGRQYVSLDDPLILDLAQNDPALFLQRFSGPILIDEI